jgi:hypothetical protein
MLKPVNSQQTLCTTVNCGSLWGEKMFINPVPDDDLAGGLPIHRGHHRIK